jgi:hypothetical protein
MEAPTLSDAHQRTDFFFIILAGTQVAWNGQKGQWELQQQLGQELLEQWGQQKEVQCQSSQSDFQMCGCTLAWPCSQTDTVGLQLQVQMQ